MVEDIAYWLSVSTVLYGISRISAQLMWSKGYRLVRWLLSASSNDEKFEKLFFVLFLIVTRHIMSSFFSFTLFHFNFSFEAKIKKNTLVTLVIAEKREALFLNTAHFCIFS